MATIRCRATERIRPIAIMTATTFLSIGVLESVATTCWSFEDRIDNPAVRQEAGSLRRPSWEDGSMRVPCGVVDGRRRPHPPHVPAHLAWAFLKWGIGPDGGRRRSRLACCCAAICFRCCAQFGHALMARAPRVLTTLWPLAVWRGSSRPRHTPRQFMISPRPP